MAAKRDHADSERRGRCWLCDAPLLAGDKAASMLGKGIFLVHGKCLERELALRKASRIDEDR